MALRRFGKVWHIYFRDDGGRIVTRSLHTTDRASAERQHRAIMAMRSVHLTMRKMARIFPDAVTTSPVPDGFGASCGDGERVRVDELYELALRNGMSDSPTRRIGWKKMRDWLSGHGVKYAGEVTPRVCKEAMDELFGGLRGSSYNSYLARIRVVFEMTMVETGISSNPMVNLPNRKTGDTVSHRNLTLDEYSLVIEKASPMLSFVAMVSRWTALRLESCIRLSPDMVDFERGVIVIKPGKTSRFNEWCCIPLFRPLRGLLEGLSPSDGESYFESQFGKIRGGTAASVSHQFSRLLRRIGVTDDENGRATFHSLRGTAITWMKEHGIKGEDLRSITGHRSTKVEDIYARDIATSANFAASMDCGDV